MTDNLRELAEKVINGTATENEAKLLHKWYDDQLDDFDKTEYVFTEQTKFKVKARILANLLKRS